MAETMFASWMFADIWADKNNGPTNVRVTRGREIKGGLRVVGLKFNRIACVDLEI